MDRQSRILALDGLRAIAILLVVAHHYFGDLTFRGKVFVNGILQGGWVGVDLFFALSGFLVTSVVLQNREAGNFLLVFYIRRVLRILVPYTVFLGACYLTLRLFHIPVHHVPWKALLLHLQPLWFAVENTWTLPFINPTWSLGIEEYFYLLMPVAVWKMGTRVLVPGAIAGLILFPIFRMSLGHLEGDNFIAIFVARPDALCWGVLLACAWARPSWKAKLLQKRRSIAFFTLITGGAVWALFQQMPVTTIPRPWLSGVFFPTIALVSVGAVISVLAANPRSFGTRVLTSRAMVYLGRISYSLYLYHYLFRWYSDETTQNLSVPHLLGVAVLAIGFAALSWELFEKHLVAYGHQFRYRARDLG